MADRESGPPGQIQNFENHQRSDKPYFYVFAPLILLSAICAVIGFIRHPGFSEGGLMLLCVGVMGVYLRARQYPIVVQDRLVRLEMRLRLERILPSDLKSRIGELKVNQLIALRFASDEELPDLTRKVLTEGISKGADIKKMIKNWQPDYFRV